MNRFSSANVFLAADICVQAITKFFLCIREKRGNVVRRSYLLDHRSIVFVFFFFRSVYRSSQSAIRPAIG
jgi:hypothetical protein